MAKNQHTFAKRQREIEKRRKAEEKRAKRQRKKEGLNVDPDALDENGNPDDGQSWTYIGTATTSSLGQFQLVWANGDSLANGQYIRHYID